MESARSSADRQAEPTAGTDLAFIEVQFPVAKLSAESYRERKAVAAQTLTGLGKWWGRKPLVLVRAIILGLLLPATDDPEADRDIFLALMTMDEDGLLQRRTKAISAKEVEAILPQRSTAAFIKDGKWATGTKRADRDRLQDEAFQALPYEEKLKFCARPEEIEGPSSAAWERITAHLGTEASSLPELVEELGQRRYGHTPSVGDAFAGGGSIPFEAARIGCDVNASDINPVAGLLTWASINVIGGGEETISQVSVAQRQVYDAVQAQIDEWGIERNEDGWVAEAYLYCNEVRDPRTGWIVPLAPNWTIATKRGVYAQLVPDQGNKRFQINIREDGTSQDLRQAASEGTWSNGVKSPVDRSGAWLEPNQRTTTSVEQLRGPSGLRPWESTEVIPRPDDTYQERLYCIRWLNPETGERHYRAPTRGDLDREAKVLNLLLEHIEDWQAEGFIPNRRIESGKKTDELIRTRGWTHWHQLFSPRQLLLNGLFNKLGANYGSDPKSAVLLMMLVARCADWNSKLSVWLPTQSSGIGGGKNTFLNQALNPILNWGTRTIRSINPVVASRIKSSQVEGQLLSLELADARALSYACDLWVTDPGYGDAVMYDELSEFFLAWYDKRLCRLFPDWYSDSRRALNIKGEGEQFRLGLTQAYSNLANHMPTNGYQVIMFTHQDPAVWADVGLTIWAAGLQVVTAWTIATETGATGLRQGNYVQGTVCLILRKRTGNTFGYLSDIHPEIADEVRRQLATMRTIDDDADPSFGDADYQLAAYAAALHVLTQYSEIDAIDIHRELSRPRKKGEKNEITSLIEQAVDIATNAMVPRGLSERTWRSLTPSERLYLKAIEIEATGEGREGIFQELARSFSVTDVRDLYATTKANQTRFKTASEFRSRWTDALGTETFGGSMVRHLLLAIFQTAQHEDTDPRPARTNLANDLGANYWQERDRMIELLTYLRRQTESLPHWNHDNSAADALITSLESHRI